MQIAGQTLTSTSGNFSGYKDIPLGQYDAKATLVGGNCSEASATMKVDISNALLCYIFSTDLNENNKIVFKLATTSNCGIYEGATQVQVEKEIEVTDTHRTKD